MITTTRRMARWAREPIATFQPNAPFDRAEGRAEGEARGVAKGKAERKAEAVVAVLEGRGLAISDETRQTLLAGRDAEMLDRWLAPPARSPPPTSCWPSRFCS